MSTLKFIEVTEAKEMYQVTGRKRMLNVNHIICATEDGDNTRLSIIEWPESLVIDETFVEFCKRLNQ